MGCGGSKTTAASSPRRRNTAGNQSNYGHSDSYYSIRQSNGHSRGTGGGGGTKASKRSTYQPVNEKGYKRRIRENLREATAHGEIEELDKCMVIFVNNKLEDGGDYADAEERMEFLLMRKEIRDACMRKHPVVLEKAIQKVENSRYKKELKPYLDRAHYLQLHQNELDTFRHDISDLDQTTVSEVRSYHHPPPGVHETMISVYMILGYQESHLTDWTEVTGLMGRYGRDSLLREIRDADTRKVDNDTKRRAQNYLGQYSLEEVRSVSNGAAAFYVWASRVVGKSEGKKGQNSAPKTQITNSRSKTNTSPNKYNNTQPRTPNTPNKTKSNTVTNKKG